MEQTKSIIKPVKMDVRMTQAMRDWADVTGQEAPPPEIYFQNMETGAEYYHIAGGIGWPGFDPSAPGYGVIMAVKRSDEDRPAVICLEEIEEADATTLLEKCMAMREKYGFGLYEGLLSHFYGAPRFNDLITREINIGSEEESRFAVTKPRAFSEPNAFELYLQRLRHAMNKEKRFHIGKCHILLNRLMSLPPDAAKDSPQRHPAVFAAAGLYYTLAEQKSWNPYGPGAFVIDDEFE